MSVERRLDERKLIYIIIVTLCAVMLIMWSATTMGTNDLNEATTVVKELKLMDHGARLQIQEPNALCKQYIDVILQGQNPYGGFIIDPTRSYQTHCCSPMFQKLMAKAFELTRPTFVLELGSFEDTETFRRQAIIYDSAQVMLAHHWRPDSKSISGEFKSPEIRALLIPSDVLIATEFEIFERS
eukprot:241794_1